MEENKNKLAFGRKNYILMLVGIAVLAVGLFIMTLDKEQYGLGFLGITLGPLVVMAGFIIELFAIMVKDKTHENTQEK
jgi:uncharacterized membrane protein